MIFFLKHYLDNKYMCFFPSSSINLKHVVTTCFLTFSLNDCDEFKCDFLLFFLRFDTILKQMIFIF